MSRLRFFQRLCCSLPVIALMFATAAAQPPTVINTQPGIGSVGGGLQSNGFPIGVERIGNPFHVPETTGGYHGEPLQRYDAAYPWLHGYFQEMPAYEGFAAFRPYNYKHIFSQSQVAGGWGMPANMPYAQQFWHRYRERARMAPRHRYSR